MPYTNTTKNQSSKDTCTFSFLKACTPYNSVWSWSLIVRAKLRIRERLIMTMIVSAVIIIWMVILVLCDRFRARKRRIKQGRGTYGGENVFNGK